MEMVDERAEEAKPEVVLVARKGGFGLPTACPVCLPVYCHLRFANVDFKLEFDRANPDSGTSIFAASLPLLPLFASLDLQAARFKEAPPGRSPERRLRASSRVKTSDLTRLKAWLSRSPVAEEGGVVEAVERLDKGWQSRRRKRKIGKEGEKAPRRGDSVKKELIPSVGVRN
ncbi:hypothetical protein GW17_00006224 [Ensete ventricosum]|nr:hypothetical protein GW17_00006224 [Ensete ventricosum]